jgi:xanthine dehydrogenase accessory factor
MTFKQVFLTCLEAAPGVLVRVLSTEGSVPREAGTWMAVFATAVVGTIGGGNLEYQAISVARDLLVRVPGPASETRRIVLGPSLGQCCGGVVYLQFERVAAADVPTLAQSLADNLQPVALFGGGHVGFALIQVLSRLPYALTWIDSRDGIFPDSVPAAVFCEHSEPVQSAVRDLASGSRVLIMSFSHAEDLDIVAQCLTRQRERGDLPYIGLIGSKTKWATFRHRLAARGYSDQELAQVTCPIGLPGISGKEPEVIAVAVAAQWLLDKA